MHGTPAGVPTAQCTSPSPPPLHHLRAKKLLNLRLFENPETDKAWDRSVKDLDLEVLCISQVSL